MDRGMLCTFPGVLGEAEILFRLGYTLDGQISRQTKEGGMSRPPFPQDNYIWEALTAFIYVTPSDHH